ncbi:hypothetical protein AgCh_013786 [Apium graveolens]
MLNLTKKTNEAALKGVRKGSLFIADLNSANEDGICCFYIKASEEQSKLWHKKLSYLNFKAINTLVKKELVRDMPNLEFAQNERTAYKVYVLEQNKIMESTYVTFDDDKCSGLECLDENKAGTLKFENLNIDIDSEDEAEFNTNHRMDEESTKKGKKEEKVLQVMPMVKKMQNSSQQTHTRKWDRSHTRETIIGDLTVGVRTRSATVNECLHAYFLSQVEPKKTEEALLDPDWISAMQEELNQFERNKVWELVPAPKNRSVIRTKWVYRNKLVENGIVTRNKASHLVLKIQNFHFVDKLLKALYGLKQAPRAWYNTLSEFLLKHGFIKVQIYVDDIIFGYTNEKLCERFSKLMQSEYEMSIMGELSYFLGLQVSQRSDGIFISQTKYVKDLLKKFGMVDCSPASTPMSTATKLDEDKKGKSVDILGYRGMIGSLFYLTSSRPYIIFVTYLCTRFQANPKESHLMAVKRIFRYLKGTPNLGLWYPKGTCFKAVGYIDAYFARCRVDRKSTSGSYQFLGQRLVSWYSKKQKYVSTSTSEDEYIATGSCCAQVLWIRN